jgi:ATP-dependent phosphoenolpyruvate carboxykinase
MNVFAQEKEKGPAADKEASLRYGKWVFGLLAGVGSVVYLVATGIVGVYSGESDEVEITQEMLDSLVDDEED